MDVWLPRLILGGESGVGGPRTQGVHVATGMATIPLVLVKFWSVYPNQFRRPPFRSVKQVVERVRVAIGLDAALVFIVGGDASDRVQPHGVVFGSHALEFGLEFGGVADLFRCGHSPLTCPKRVSLRGGQRGEVPVSGSASGSLAGVLRGRLLESLVNVPLDEQQRVSDHRPAVENVSVGATGQQRVVPSPGSELSVVERGRRSAGAFCLHGFPPTHLLRAGSVLSELRGKPTTQSPHLVACSSFQREAGAMGWLRGDGVSRRSRRLFLRRPVWMPS
jgi:hypothetical protein